MSPPPLSPLALKFGCRFAGFVPSYICSAGRENFIFDQMCLVSEPYK